MEIRGDARRATSRWCWTNVPPYPCEHDYAARSLELTARWAQRCKQRERRTSTFNVQHSTRRARASCSSGSCRARTFEDLRRASAEATVRIGFDWLRRSAA